MSDRIAVMSRGQRRADRHAGGDLRRPGERLRRRLHRVGQPAARHARVGRRRRCAGRARQRRRRRRPAADRRRDRRPGHRDAAAGAARARQRRPPTAVTGSSSRTSSTRAPSAALIVDLTDGTEVVATVDADGETTGDPHRVTRSPSTGTPTRRTCCAGGPPSSAPTTTDVDEVQAALDGIEAVPDGGAARRGRAAARAQLRPAGADRRWRRGRRGRRGRRRARRRPAAAEATTRGRGDGGTGGGGVGTGDSEVRILNWQAYIDPTEDGTHGDGRPLPGRHGHRRRLQRGLQRQQRGVPARSSPRSSARAVSSTSTSSARRTGWRPGCRTLAGSTRCPLDRIPNSVNLEDRFLNQPWDFQARVQPAVAGRDHRHRLQPGADRTRADAASTDLFDPEFNGQGGDAHRDARHRRARHARDGHSTPAVVDETGAMRGARHDRRRPRRTDRSGRSPATTTSAACESGDFVACVAWSGDVVQLQYDRPDMQFVIPDEGGISWYDTMVIPKGAPNAFAAADWMNFVYDPVQAAQLTY